MNKPVRLRGVMLDITERKKAELELQQTSTQLQLLIKRMPFGCIMWDAEYKVELWNPAAEKIFGFSSAEVVGLHPYDFLDSAPGQRAGCGSFHATQQRRRHSS